MKNIVFVLSMHRSGSSLLARGLECCSVALGDNLMSPAADNPKGFFEDQRVYSINEHILAALDYQWSLVGNPPNELTPQIKAMFGEMIEEYLQKAKLENADSNYIGIKDPRLCRVAYLWFEKCAELSIPYKVIFIYRNPTGVAASLHRRNNISPKGAAALWSDYNMSAMQNCLKIPTFLISIEKFILDIEGHLEVIAQFLDTKPVRSSVEQFVSDFYERDLFQESPGAPDLSSELYENLEKYGAAREITDAEKQELIETAVAEQKKPDFVAGVLEQMNWHRKAENESLRLLIQQQALQISKLHSELAGLYESGAKKLQ